MFLIKILSNIYLVAIIHSIITLWMTETWYIMSRVSASRSTPKPHWSAVLHRQKRALIFPSGSHFKFTLSLGKRLLAKYPKGLNFNLEAAAYYPLPTAHNWKGGNSINSGKDEKMPSTSNATDTIKSSSDWFNNDNDLYISQGAWSSSSQDWPPSHDVHYYSSLPSSSLKIVPWKSSDSGLYKFNDNLNRWHLRAKRNRRGLPQYFEGFTKL